MFKKAHLVDGISQKFALFLYSQAAITDWINLYVDSLNKCHHNMALSCPSSPHQSHLESLPSPFSPLKICLLCPRHANQPQARIEVFKYI